METVVNIKQEVQLKQWVIQKISLPENRRIRMALMEQLEKSENTIWRYLRINHRLLSKDYTLHLIAAYLQIDPDQFTEPRKESIINTEIEDDE